MDAGYPIQTKFYLCIYQSIVARGVSNIWDYSSVCKHTAAWVSWGMLPKKFFH